MSDLISTQDEDSWRWYGTVKDPYIYPSVTTIIENTVANKGLESWYKANTAKKIEKHRESTASFGTDAHTYFDKILRREQFDIPETHAKHIESFRKWANEHKLKPVKTEFLVHSDTYGFAGRVDYLGLVDGVPVIADWKTGTRFRITYGWQLAAYRLAALEQEKELTAGTLGTLGIRGVQIRRDTGEVKSYPYAHIDFVEHAFLSTLDVFKALYYNKLKKLEYRWLHHQATKSALS